MKKNGSSPCTKNLTMSAVPKKKGFIMTIKDSPVTPDEDVVEETKKDSGRV